MVALARRTVAVAMLVLFAGMSVAIAGTWSRIDCAGHTAPAAVTAEDHHHHPVGTEHIQSDALGADSSCCMMACHQAVPVDPVQALAVLGPDADLGPAPVRTLTSERSFRLDRPPRLIGLA